MSQLSHNPQNRSNIFYMASSFLKSICCCCWPEIETDPVYDETTRLIPEEPATDLYVFPNLYVMGADHEFFFVQPWLVQMSTWLITRGSMSDLAELCERRRGMYPFSLHPHSADRAITLTQQNGKCCVTDPI